MPNPPHQAQNPEVVELDASAPIEDIVDVIKRDGGIIIKNFLSPETIDKIHAEAKPYWNKLGKYSGKLFDAADPPLSGFAGKSRTFAQEAINHPTYREVAKAILKEESNVYRDGKRYKTVSYPVLAVSEAFNRGSPSTAQQLHRDDMAQPFEHLKDSGESSLLGLLLGGVDTNYTNGATQVIVGSHQWPETSIRGPADRSFCSTCEMNKGDAVFIIGSIWHGAGENQTSPPERRIIYSCHMTRGSYNPEMQALLGWSVSHPYCGHVDGKDPITLLDGGKDPFGYEDLKGSVVGA
ncbi:phytanoyl-CoA dioxygenase family protein [Aspergillus stella-maris]|uniref:phytanoyl-CoA dioxygenase family protein n=1 Tax=Aspergillus stella-maris TaxID=1810926 RepID=UPI003CCE412D